MHADDRREGAFGALGRHQHPFDLDAALPHPAHGAHVGEDPALDDVLVERRPSYPGVRRVVEPRQLRCLAVRLMRRPDVGGVVGDHAGGRGDRVADERVAAPPLFTAPVEPDTAARVAGTVGTRVPERTGVGPGRRADRLQVRPGVGRAARREVDDPQAARQQAVVARVPLDDRDAIRIRRELEALQLPRGLVQGHRGPSREIEARDLRLVPTRARVIARHERDDGVVAVPRDLPHAQVGRTGLGRGTGGEVDQEQPPPRIAGPAHDRIGRRLRPGHGPCAPIESVRARVRGEDQQPPTVARPRDALA